MSRIVSARPRVLVALLERLNAPPVASRLSKEELCLSFGALEKIKSCDRSQGSDTGRYVQGHHTLTAPMLHSLKTRALQFVPTCSPREIGMIAGGCQVLRTDSCDLVDHLVEKLYLAAEHGHSLTLTEITHVLEAALSEQSGVFNLTLRDLIHETCPTVLSRSPTSAATLERFLCSVKAYASCTMDASQTRAWYQTMREVCPQDNAPLADVVSKYAALSDQRLAKAHERTESPSPLDQNETDSTADRAYRDIAARRRLFNRLATSDKIADTSATPASSRFSASELTETMETLAFYRWRDPVARALLLSEAQTVLRRGSPTDVERVKQAAVHAGAVFHHLFESSPSSSALSTVTAASRAYHMLVTDKREVPADLLRAVQEEDRAAQSHIATTPGDDEAPVVDSDAPLTEEMMRFYVLQGSGIASAVGTLEAFGKRLSRSPAPHALSEVALSVRCARRDDTSVLAHAIEPRVRAAIEDASDLLERASLDDLLALADALSLPTVRGTQLSPAFTETMQAAASAVASQMVRHAERATTAPQDALSIIERIHALTCTGEVFTAEFKDSVCRQLLTQLHTRRLSPSQGAAPLLTRSMCVALMRFFETADMVCEPLMDGIAECMARDVEAVLQSVSAKTEAPSCAADLLDLCVCQIALDAPELHHTAWCLMDGVARADVLEHVSSAETVLSALAVAASPAGKAQHVAALLAHLENLSVDGLSPRSQNNTLRLLTYVAARYPLPGEVIRKVLFSVTQHPATASMNINDNNSGATRDEDGELWLEALLLASYASPDTSASTVPESVGRSALSFVKYAASDLFTRLCRRAPQIAALYPTVPPSQNWAPLVVDSLVAGLSSHLDWLSFKEMADCVFYLGQTPEAGQRLSHQVMANTVADHVVNAADELLWNGQDIARLLRGLSLFHHTDRAIFVVCTARLQLRPVAATLDQPSAALLFSAMGDVRFVDPTLINRLSRAFTRHAAELNAADLFLAVRSHSRVLLRNDAFYQAMGDELARRPDQLSVEAVLGVLSAYATVEQPHDSLADVFAGSLVAALPTLNANSVTDALTSLWLMDVDVSMNKHAAQLVSFVAERSGELTSASLVKLCSIVRDLQWKSVPLLEAIARRSIALYHPDSLVVRQPGLTAEQCRIVLDTLGMFLIHAPEVRRLLSESARTVSKESTALSQDNATDGQPMSRLAQ